MTRISIVLRQYFEQINDIESLLDLFADDGALNFDTCARWGLPKRYEGKSAIRSLLQMVCLPTVACGGLRPEDTETAAMGNVVQAGNRMNPAPWRPSMRVFR
jgi:hypothetical protein